MGMKGIKFPFVIAVVGAIRCAVCDSTVQAGNGLNNFQQSTMDQSCFGTGGQVAPLKTCADTHPYCITLTKYNYDGNIVLMVNGEKGR
jgi:hypothetical protein